MESKENKVLTVELQQHEYDWLNKLSKFNQRSMSAELRYNFIKAYREVFGDDSNV